MLYDLKCIYDTRASFYGKAVVKQMTNELELYSYNTLVASIITKNGAKIYKYFGQYSQTTTRHQKEFFKQNGLCDKQIKELFKIGTLEVLI